MAARKMKEGISANYVLAESSSFERRQSVIEVAIGTSESFISFFVVVLVIRIWDDGGYAEYTEHEWARTEVVNLGSLRC